MDKNNRRYWGPERDEYSDRPSILFLADHLPWLDGCQKIIDLGCGVGNLVKKLIVSGKEAVGITYQKREVEAGKRKHGLDLILADMHELPFNNSSFDGMVMWDSLEHCTAPYIALCEARRVVRPGGRGLIFMPGQDWQDCRYHLIVLTQKQMVHLLKQSGWKLERLADRSTQAKPETAVYEVVNDPNYRAGFMR
ncbi:MAG: class I SAM-dependent methyltransferase [Dethiobacter sp.]|jgi:ubiquinone/menaquinone biosynthesis C-methylase UbiE|nr:MAG: class I SAM-dependent methyltransferase [Dethiobacter sp.]